jgi:hypothetical protein
MTHGRHVDSYDPTGTDSAVPTVDSGWPAAYDPSGDAPHLSESAAPRRHGLGLFALVLAGLVIVGTIVASILIGTAGGQFATDSTADGFDYNLAGSGPGVAAVATATVWQYVLGTAFGVWAIVQGIVAIAKNRGRLFGVLAILVAASGPLVSIIVTVIAASQHLPN